MKVKQFPDLIKFGKQTTILKSNSSINKNIGVLSFMKIPEEFIPFEVSLLNMENFSYNQPNLISYILSYLSNPLNMVAIKPKMLDAMLHFLIFVIRRGLLSKEEIQIFHNVIFHYFKNLIGRFSGTDTHKTQEMMAKEIRRKIIRSNTRKGTLERGV